MGRVFQISDAASIAMHSMALIASSGNEKLNNRQIAQTLRVSQNHLAKIMQLLVKHGYLDSNRGPSGGYTLRRQPEEINLLDVYQLVEGVIDCNVCHDTSMDCPFSKCIYGSLPETVNSQITNYLRNTKLSDVKIKNKQNA
jgi:Rrf2 family protein